MYSEDVEDGDSHNALKVLFVGSTENESFLKNQSCQRRHLNYFPVKTSRSDVEAYLKTLNEKDVDTEWCIMSMLSVRIDKG